MIGDNNTQNPSTTGKLAKSITAIILAFIGILGSVQLLKDHSISEVIFVGLCSLSSIIGLFIGFIERIKVLSLKDLKLTLHKIEDSKKEIKDLALAVADLVEAASAGSIVTEDYDDTKFKDSLKRVREI
jgi:hypothetical protein